MCSICLPSPNTFDLPLYRNVYILQCIMFHTVMPLVMMKFVLQNGWSPLHTASFNGHLDIMRELIEAGVSISQTNKVGTVLVRVSLHN